MDRFEKALDKAGVEQYKVNEGFRSISPQSEFNPINIAYSQTKRQISNPEILSQRRVVASQIASIESEAFRMLRTKVLKRLRANQWHSFAVTGASKNAGKTLVAVNLAIAMAMEVNQTVLLVDMDLRAPKIDWYFGVEVEYGLSDYLVSDMPLANILINPGFERLVILPGKGKLEGASELISGHKMRALIKEIKNRYRSRIIIFDLPPVLACDDVLVSADYFDAFLLVVEEGGNTPEQVKKALQILSGSHLLGMVLNKSVTNSDCLGYY